MNLHKYIFIIFLSVFCQSKIIAKSTEETIFYEQILSFYEINDMQKFYNLLTKFQKAYPQSSFKNTLFTLAAKKLYEDKNYKDAVFFFNRIDKESLSKMQSYYAECHLKLKNYEKVISIYEKSPFKDLKSKQIITEAYIGISNKKDENIEKRKASIHKAIKVLESQREELSDDYLLVLAKLYIQSNQFKKSANILKKLLVSESSQKEDILLQLSLVQKNYNPNLAIKTLSKIIKMDGKQKKLAAYKKMELLFEKNRFKELIANRDELEKNLKKSYLPLLHYYLGIAFFNNNELIESEKQFNIYLVDPQEHKNLKLIAFKNLQAIAERKNDTTLLNNVNNSISAFKNEKTAKLLKSQILRAEDNFDLSKALSFKKEKKYEIAEKYLIQLLKNPATKEKPSIHFELAHLYYLSSQYKKSKAAFKSFIKINPKNSLTSLAWNYYIDSSINLANDPSSAYAKEHLMYDVTLCLQQNQHLNKLERTELLFLLARVQYEVKAFEEAIVTTKQLIKNKQLNKDILSKCYLILGYAYKNAFGDQKSFKSYVKKASAINPILIKNEKVQAILEIKSTKETLQAEN